MKWWISGITQSYVYNDVFERDCDTPGKSELTKKKMKYIIFIYTVSFERKNEKNGLHDTMQIHRFLGSVHWGFFHGSQFEIKDKTFDILFNFSLVFVSHYIPLAFGFIIQFVSSQIISQDFNLQVPSHTSYAHINIKRRPYSV